MFSVALFLAAATLQPESPGSDDGGAVRVPPDAFVEMVANDGVDATGVVVDGDVDLGRVGRVERLLRCRECTIRGALRAVDVRFERVVDLGGIHVEGDFDVRGAGFSDVFILGDGQGHGAQIGGRADLSLASFGGLTALDAVTFGGAVNASNITTSDVLSLSGAQFGDAVTFSHARLGSSTVFSGASFAGPALFELANFADAALFRDATFGDDVSFASADFDGRVDFSSAEFDGAAAFDDVVLEAPGTFRRINALGPVSWEQAFAQSLDFSGSVFESGVRLSGISTTGVLRLDEVTVVPASGIRMGVMDADGLRIDVATVEQIAGRDTRIEALELLEATAEADGDLASANAARYALLATLNERNYGLAHWLDDTFYRGAAGYLVRPVHPIVVLAVLILLGALIRAATRRDRPLRLWDGARLTEGPSGRRHPSREAVAAAGSALVAGFHDAMRQVVRVRRSDAGAQGDVLTIGSAARSLESIANKVLLAIVVISLGNSSSTLREVIDAVRG